VGTDEFVLRVSLLDTLAFADNPVQEAFEIVELLLDRLFLQPLIDVQKSGETDRISD